MPDQLQLRGGTTTEHNSFTGAAREVTVDTTKKTLVVHDGSQAGGTPLMKESGATAASSVTIGTGGVERLTLGSTEVVVNETGTDTDFRVEGNNNINLLICDAGNDRVGIGLNNPATTLSVDGVTKSNVNANDGVSTAIRTENGGTGTTIASYGFASGNSQKASIRAHVLGNGAMMFHNNNDTEKMRIDASGNVGIGTTSPNADVDIATSVEDSTGTLSAHGIRLFHVGATDEEVIPITGGFLSQVDRARAGIGFISQISGSSEGYGGAVGFYTRNTADGNGLLRSDERMRIDSSGNVGIGTTSPAAGLTIAKQGTILSGTSNSYGFNINLLSSGYVYLDNVTGAGNNTSMALRTYNNGTYTQFIQSISGNETTFETAGSERMRIDSSGNVGIGTTSPSAIFVVSNAGAEGLEVSHSSGTVELNAYNRSGSARSPVDIIGQTFKVLTGNPSLNNGLFQDSSGNVGIGTTSPSAKFHVSRSTDNAIACQITNSGTTGGHGLKVVSGGTGVGTHIFNCFRDNSEEVLRLDGDGVLTSRRYQGNANGGDFWEFNQSAGGSSSAATFNLYASSTAERHHIAFLCQDVVKGSISASSSGTTYATSSDYRLKENVVSISDGITRLKTLKPYRFNFKVDPDKTVDGFFAHEVTAVPEAISGTKDEVVTQAMIDAGEYEEGTLNNPIYQGIDQSKLVPLLVAAVQELITKVETLEAA